MEYGWRGRIGILYPAGGVPAEIEFHKKAPDGVAILTTRLPLENATYEALLKMADHIEESASVFSRAELDLIALCCTAGSFIQGMGYDKEIIRRLEDSLKVTAITTSTAVIDSLNFLQVKKVAVVTPYSDELNELEKHFLEDNGFEVTSIKGLGIIESIDIEKVRPEQMYRLAKNIFTEDVEAIFFSCAGLRVLEIIEPLENDLNRPVVTSNQATFWSALRKINVMEKIDGLGKIFS